MDQVRSVWLTQRRANVLLCGAFAVLALALGALGVSGVMAYSVAQRKHEIGLRMALGANRRDVIGMVVTRGMAVIGVGMVAGIGLSLGLNRYLASQLWGVRPSDAVSLVVVGMVICAAGFVACVVPATRAAYVDPIVTLRHE